MTNKELLFCELVAKGITQTKAYIQSGYSNNYSPNALKTKAHKLAQKHKGRINEIRSLIGQMAEEQNIWNREIAINTLKRVIEDCCKDGEIKEKRSYISACAELNKMCGFYAPYKHEIRTSILEDETIDSILKNLGYRYR